MKVKDILNKQFSVLSNISGFIHHQGVTDYTQTVLTLKQIINLGNKYSNHIDKLREMEYHSDEQSLFKQKFPCWFTGGIFPINKTYDKEILEYSNILAIDIDKKDNTNIDLNEIKQKIFNLPYVFLVSKSISGKGIYALILLEDGKKTKQYYMYLYKLWKFLFNINIDQQCNNIGRKRFISYDNDLLIKTEETEIKEWSLTPLPEDIERYKPKLIDYKPNKIIDNSLTRKAIWYLLNNGYSIDDISTQYPYNTWWHIGCDFRHFEDGENMFIKFSNNTTKYNDNISKILAKWKQTKIENTIEDISKKWCGICKHRYGANWISLVNQQYLF